MRSEKEVREHRDSLRLLDVQRCSCAMRGGLHEAKCEAGRIAMRAAIKVLSWALGDKECEAAVKHLNKGAEEIRQRARSKRR